VGSVMEMKLAFADHRISLAGLWKKAVRKKEGVWYGAAGGVQTRSDTAQAGNGTSLTLY
jgi:hypothetical protein